jgi:tripeptidyl-peptidase-1
MLAINLLKTGGFLLSAVSVLAVPVVVESLNKTPAGWEESDSPSPDQFIDLSIGLEPEDDQLLDRTLYEVSDPDHPKYGQHLSRESAKDLLRPSRAAKKSVKRWLSEAGVPDHYVRDEGEWLHIRTTVKNAEGMLSTRFSVFARDDKSIVRTREYSVPHEIRRHIASIQPTTLFSSVQDARDVEEIAHTVMRRDAQAEKKPRSTKIGNYGGPGPIDLEKCKTEVTPACIRKLYKMPKEYPKAAKGSLYTTVSFQNVRVLHLPRINAWLTEIR